MAFQSAGTMGAAYPVSGSKIFPVYFADFLRSNLYSSLFFRQLGTKVTIPRSMGDSVKIPRWKSGFKTVTGRTTISSGRQHSAVSISSERYSLGFTPYGLCAESISGSVTQFAGARGYNDKLVIVAYADFMEGALESLAKELAWRMDGYTRQNISAHSQVVTVVGGTTLKAHTADVLTGKTVAKIAPIFDAQNIPRWDDDTHVAIGHPLIQYDIYRDISANGWLNVAQYGDPERIYRGEIGQMYGVRFLVSGSLPISVGANATSATFGVSVNATGSNLYALAPDAFYALELEDGGVEVIHHELGSAGSYDPVNTVGTIGTKVFYGVLPAPAADYRILRIPHGLGLATF